MFRSNRGNPGPHRLASALALRALRARTAQHAGPLALVAIPTRDDDIVPRSLAAVEFRGHMVEGGVLEIDRVVTVLTSATVAGPHICFGELWPATSTAEGLVQSGYSGHIDFQPAMHYAIGVRADDVGVALPPGGEDIFPVPAIVRPVVAVEDQNFSATRAHMPLYLHSGRAESSYNQSEIVGGQQPQHVEELI
jgi:hypothetical protein